MFEIMGVNCTLSLRIYGNGVMIQSISKGECVLIQSISDGDCVMIQSISKDRDV